MLGKVVLLDTWPVSGYAPSWTEVDDCRLFLDTGLRVQMPLRVEGVLNPFPAFKK